MKNLILTFFVLAGSLACVSQDKTTSITVLSAEEFQEKISSSEDIQLIDVRTAAEYNEGNIEDSQLLDYLNDDLENAISSLDKNKAVYLYCASGNRSGKAAKLLEKNGFNEIYDLDGGYSNWPYKKEQ